MPTRRKLQDDKETVIFNKKSVTNWLLISKTADQSILKKKMQCNSIKYCKK